MLTVSISEMLLIQEATNAVDNENWRQAGTPWHRDIYVAAVSALAAMNAGSDGASMPVFKSELLRIWRAGLSLWLENESAEKPVDALPRRIALNLRSSQKKHKPFPSARQDVIREKRYALVDKLIAAAGGGHFDFDSFVGLMVHSGLSFEQLCMDCNGSPWLVD